MRHEAREAPSNSGIGAIPAPPAPSQASRRGRAVGVAYAVASQGSPRRQGALLKAAGSGRGGDWHALFRVKKRLPSHGYEEGALREGPREEQDQAEGLAEVT